MRSRWEEAGRGACPPPAAAGSAALPRTFEPPRSATDDRPRASRRSFPVQRRRHGDHCRTSWRSSAVRPRGRGSHRADRYRVARPHDLRSQKRSDHSSRSCSLAIVFRKKESTPGLFIREDRGSSTRLAKASALVQANWPLLDGSYPNMVIAHRRPSCWLSTLSGASSNLPPVATSSLFLSDRGSRSMLRCCAPPSVAARENLSRSQT